MYLSSCTLKQIFQNWWNKSSQIYARSKEWIWYLGIIKIIIPFEIFTLEFADSLSPSCVLKVQWLFFLFWPMLKML